MVGTVPLIRSLLLLFENVHYSTWRTVLKYDASMASLCMTGHLER